MEANEYRKRVATIATSLVGSAKNLDDDLYEENYENEMALKPTEDYDSYKIGKFCVYVMRLAGVPASIFPNYLRREDFDRLGATEDMPPAKGDVVLIQNGFDDEVAIVTEVGQRSLSLVCRIPLMDSNDVWAKNIATGSDFILGRISPDYGFERTRGLLRKTQVPLIIKSTFIRRFQRWLKSKGDETIATDGNITKAFIKSLVTDWQAQLNRSAKAGIPVTGVFGAESARGANSKILATGSRGNLVYILQGSLYAHGYDPKGFDGKFTKSTREAVIAFQKARKLQESGTSTAETWESLLTKW